MASVMTARSLRAERGDARGVDKSLELKVMFSCDGGATQLEQVQQ